MRGAVHDRNQVKEPAPDRDIGDVGAPDLVRPLDRQALEPVWIDPVRGMRGAWSSAPGRFVNGGAKLGH